MSDTDKPSSTFEKLKGKVKEKAGSVLGDKALATEGRLDQSKVDLERAAAAKDAEAAVTEEQADLDRRLQENALETERLAAEQREKEAKAAVEAEQRAAESQAETEAARKEDAVKARKDQELAVAEAKAAEAARQRADAEAEAEQVETKAQAARAAADAIEDHISD